MYSASVSNDGPPAGDTAYNPRAFPPFAVTVDIAVLTVTARGLSSVLIRRAKPPFEDGLALPGGFEIGRAHV